jgi:succinoglycan biosynthesis transport protein ExoP
MPSEKIERYSATQMELERPPRYLPPAYAEPEPEEPAVPLSHYLWIFRRNAWKMLTFVAVCMVVTFVVSSRLQPIYEATARVDIDRRAPSGVIGQESSENAGNDTEEFLTTQIELIQSDAVVRPVAIKYGLLQHENQIGRNSPERDRQVAGAPIVLRNLKVTRPPNSFLLRISYRSPDPQLAAHVANAVAQSYIEHTYEIRIRSSLGLSSFMEKQIEELKAKMEQSSQALAAYDRELNVINPEEKTNILSSRLLQLNTEYTNAQGDRVRKEAAYNSIKTGSLAAAQISTQGEALGKLQDLVQAAQQKLADVRTTYGVNHPEYRKASNQLAEIMRQFQQAKADVTQRVAVDYQQAADREDMLRKSVGETKAEYDKLNLHSYQYQQLKRSAEADRQVYEELERKIKEAGINAGFQSSAIRIADSARPGSHPVFPNARLNLLIAFLLASLLAAGTSVLMDALDNTLKDPEQVMRTLQIDIIGTLPTVKGQSRMLRLPSVRKDDEPEGTITDPARGAVGNSYKGITSYEEAIRTLRNAILLTDFDRRLNSLLVTSASPGEGKSTTCIHLAIAHADQGKKTLIIDADLRRPTVHKRFGLSASVGLSDVLTGMLNWRDVVVQVSDRPHLFVIPAGPASRRASDLIGPMMVDILDEASKEYDLIMVDAPPILGFAEPLQMATAVDGVVMVAYAGETSRKAVATALATLRRLHANIVGLALNQVKKELSDSYYYYGYYRKYYQQYYQAVGERK